MSMDSVGISTGDKFSYPEKFSAEMSSWFLNRIYCLEFEICLSYCLSYCNILDQSGLFVVIFLEN